MRYDMSRSDYINEYIKTVCDILKIEPPHIKQFGETPPLSTMSMFFPQECVLKYHITEDNKQYAFYMIAHSLRQKWQCENAAKFSKKLSPFDVIYTQRAVVDARAFAVALGRVMHYECLQMPDQDTAITDKIYTRASEINHEYFVGKTIKLDGQFRGIQYA